MYHVELGDLNGNNKVLYYPTDEKCVALEPVLKRKVGDCGEFNIKIPVSNVLYSQISELKIITIYRNNKEKWRGYIKEITTSFNKTLNLYCIEDMGWLNYEFLTPESKKVRRDVQLQALINAYNNQNGIAGTAKVFEVGTVSSGASTEITYETTYEDSILDCLRIVAGSDRYVKVRRENGKRYIDIASLATYGKRSSQSIELGSNMLDYVKELNTGYMLNVIYPYGDEEEGKELYSGVMSRLKGTPLVNNESIAKYGRIAKNIIFSTSDLNTLNENASAYLNRNKDPRLSMDLTAVDMADLGVDTDDFELGDEIHTLATPFGIDQYIYITEQSINIQSVTKNKYKLSSTVSSNGLASQTATISAELQKIPTKASILETALSNAVNLLSAAKGGYVAYKFNDAGQPTEIRIQNSLNNNQVTKKWVWNENGFGYMYIDSDPNSSTYGQWKSNVAITIDGEIIASFITAGEMLADRIRGGSLEVGGTGTAKDGSIIIKDSNGNNLITLDKKGIKFENGGATQMTTITQNAITTEYINGLEVIAGSVAAENITGVTIEGKTIKGGKVEQGDTDSTSADFVLIENGIIKCRTIQSNSNDRDSKLLFPEGARFNDEVWFQGDTYSAKITCGSMGNDSESAYLENYKVFAKLRQNGDESAGYFVPFFTGSDRRLKSNINQITNAKDFISKLKPCHYNYCKSKRTSFGLIAQDVKDVLDYYNFDSNLVCYDNEDDMYSLDYIQFHAWEIAGIKELYSEVDSLKNEITLLKDEINKLKGDK